MPNLPISTKTPASRKRPVGRPRSDGKPHLTKSEVFKVSAKLIAQYGYAGTGIRLIASELDISTASFFHLFGSKDAMLNQLIVFATQHSLDFHARVRALNLPPEIALYKSLFEETRAVASADRSDI